MTGFLCVFAPEHRDSTEDVLSRRLHPLRSKNPDWRASKRVSAQHFAAAITGELRATCAFAPSYTLVGTARIDNRKAVASLGGLALADQSDQTLLLHAFIRRGPSFVELIEGDFAFVIHDEGAGRLLVARDPFGMKRIFYARSRETVAFSESLTTLADGAEIDPGFVGGYLTGAVNEDASATIWKGCHSVRPGSYVVHSSSGSKEVQYWPKEPVGSSSSKIDEREACAQFETLFESAVKTRVEGAGPMWSEVSGGLDSTAVTAMATRLARNGAAEKLVGTYSFVDDMAGADERGFIRDVITDLEVRNEQFANPYPWDHDGEPPPQTDEPRTYYASWARDRRAQRMVLRSGASVVLSGGGSDYYLTGSPVFLADLIASGNARASLAQANEIAVSARVSTWRVFWRFGILPLLPRALSARLGSPAQKPPVWVTRQLIDTFGLDRRMPSVVGKSDDATTLFASSQLRSLAAANQFAELPVDTPAVEKRFPFFDRKLVEFVLSLPTRMVLRNTTTKWVLRESLSDLMPRSVLNRTSKGWIDGRTCWALARKAPLIKALLADPILAQLGCVDAGALRQGVENARDGITHGTQPLMCALSLETWLAVRLGRWPEAVASL